VAEATGYGYEGRLRGLEQPVQAGFVTQEPGASAPRLHDRDRIAIFDGILINLFGFVLL